MSFDQYPEDWSWNHSHAETECLYVSENQVMTALRVDVGLNNAYVFKWSFIYGSQSKPLMTHEMSVTMDEVISKYDGSINEAKIHHSFVGYLAFKKKLIEMVKYSDGTEENVDMENRINKKKE